jgi:hypothetical protein
LSLSNIADDLLYSLVGSRVRVLRLLLNLGLAPVFLDLVLVGIICLFGGSMDFF